MDGPQNGQQGFAGFDEIPAKDAPQDEPWPQEDVDWEGPMTAMFALMTFPLPGSPQVNLPMLRWARETMPPRDYSNMSYYELWLLSTVMNCIYTGRGGLTAKDFVDAGIVSQQQIDRATAIHDAGLKTPVPGFGAPDADGKFDPQGYKEGTASPPKFAVGDKVRGILQNTPGHTRQYNYWRGRVGAIDTVYPAEPPAPPSSDPAAPPTLPSGTYTAGFDDVASRGLQEFFVPLYSVRFRTEDIWGEEFAEPKTVIYGDQFETYIKKES